MLLLVIPLAFCCEMVDSALGMGYGTTLTPLLLFMGYQPLEIVPAALCSEFLSGIAAGYFHHEFGNIDLRPGSRDFRVFLLLTTLSIIGVVVAVIIAVRLPAWAVKLYIGVLVLALGVYILRNHKKGMPFSWRRIAGIGFLAAFNKGISGGGYGPVVTGGQVLSGVKGKSAVGIASLAEGITSLVGAAVYLLSGAAMPWHLAIPISVGALLSVPFAAYLVSRIPAVRFTLLIGGMATTLGGFTLIRLLI
jgi:uncharacterized membrane protein YfcA